MSARQLAAALDDPDVEVRRRAVLSASELRDRLDAPLLLRALGDADWRVREEAVRVVGQIAVELGLLDGLIEAICQGANVGLRTAAREVLQGLGAAASHAVIAALPTVPPNARKFLLDTLVCDGVDEVLSILVAEVRGDDPMNAVSAMDALASLGGERAEHALRERLATGDTFLRAGALDALEKLGVPLPWHELEPLLADRLLARLALDALGRSKDPRAIAPLVLALTERSRNVRARAVLGLQRLLRGDAQLRAAVTSALSAQPPAVIDELAAFCEDDDPQLALAALFVAACASSAGSVRAALTLLSRGAARSDVIEAFAGWQQQAASAALALADESAPLRAPAFSFAAALAVDRAAQDKLLSRLRSALADRDADVQLAALRALGAVGEAQDAAALVHATQQTDEDSAQAAALALRELAARHAPAVRDALGSAVIAGPASSVLAELLVTLEVPDALSRLRAALLSDSVPARVSAIVGLSLLGAEAAVELVALALNDENPEVQVAAIDALPRMRTAGSRVVDALLLFDSSDADVQAALAGSLAALKDPRAIERLRKLARVGPPGVRVFAMQGLRGLSDPALDELLMEALSDADPEVVKQALTVLGATGSARTVARVAIALDHSAWDVRRLAASLLGEAGDSSALPALQARLGVENDGLVRMAIEEALAALEAR